MVQNKNYGLYTCQKAKKSLSDHDKVEQHKLWYIKAVIFYTFVTQF